MAKDSQAAAAAPDKSAQTPAEHAAATGNVVEAATNGPRFGGMSAGPSFTWQHAAAAQLHGWNAHALATVDPFTLSRADYEAALKVAAEPDAKGNYVPHAPACSKFCPFLPKGADK